MIIFLDPGEIIFDCLEFNRQKTEVQRSQVRLIHFRYEIHRPEGSEDHQPAAGYRYFSHKSRRPEQIQQGDDEADACEKNINMPVGPHICAFKYYEGSQPYY